jgi:NarL family two-component system response regulator LiaR
MNRSAERIKVLIVDDHQVVRQGLRTFLDLLEDIQVIGEASDGAKAVEMTRELAPDVILMDLVMPGMDGISATARIKALGSAAKVIALTSFAEDDRLYPAIQAGACCYLLKDVTPEALAEAIRAAQRGEVRLQPEIQQKLLQHASQPAAAGKADLPSGLTDREAEVIRLVARGKSNREISQALVLSEKTVKTHVSNILGKLGLADRTQLAIFALKNGLADPEEG